MKDIEDIKDLLDEGHYWFVIQDVVDLIKEHGYNTVLSDINECLNPLKEHKSYLKDEEE